MSVEIGGEARPVKGPPHHCPHCDFGFSVMDVVSNIVLARGNMMQCRRCHKESYLTQDKDAAYWLVFLLGLAICATLIIFFTIAVPMMTYQGDSFRVSFGMIFAGFVIGILIFRGLLKITAMFRGYFSADDLHRSMMNM